MFPSSSSVTFLLFAIKGSLANSSSMLSISGKGGAEDLVVGGGVCVDAFVCGVVALVLDGMLKEGCGGGGTWGVLAQSCEEFFIRFEVAFCTHFPCVVRVW